MAEMLPVVINQGEDWAVQILWTDGYDDPLPVIHPCRMSIRQGSGQIVAELETNPDIPEDETPSISLSTETGLIQLRLAAEHTAALPPGVYQYDLFVSLDATEPAGDQIHRMLFGPVTVNKRITLM